MEQTPGEGVEAVDLDDCVKTVFNEKGEMMQLYDECTYFSGGILETAKGFFELEIGQSGTKKTGTVKKAQRTEELKHKMVDMELEADPEFEKWLEENEGSLTAEKILTAEDSTETHLVEIGVLGDFDFYEKMGKDAKKIKEYLTIALNMLAAGIEKLPNTKTKITSNSYYKTNPSWMENAKLDSDAYIHDMNKHALAAAGVDSKKVDVWVYVTGKNFMGSTAGWAYRGSTCQCYFGDNDKYPCISGTVNEIASAAVGSKQDAWALAHTAAHEVGHTLNFHHDFTDDSTRSPRLCNSDETFGVMHYKPFDLLKNRLETNGKVWSPCSLSNYAQWLKYIKANNKYCLTGAAKPQPTTTTPAPPPKGECGNCGNGAHGKGCSVSAIQTCVCKVDSFCCDISWDHACVRAVWKLCKVTCK